MPEVQIEVVFGLAAQQSLLSVTVATGSSVADVLAASDIEAMYPGFKFGELPVGIWGRIVGRDQIVGPGDRVEVYRPLELDPREARRQLALSGQTMGHGQKD